MSELRSWMDVHAGMDARRLAARLRGGTAVLVAAAGVGGLLPLLSGAPAVHAPTLAAALQTAMTCGALAAAWLMRARFLDSQSVRDLLATGAVWTLGLVSLCDRLLPTVVTAHAGASVIAAQLWSELVPAGLLAAAALMFGGRLAARPRRLLAVTAGGSLGAVLAVTLAGLLLGPVLLGGGGAIHGLRGRPAAMVPCLIALVLLGAAAVGLSSRQDEARPDPAAAHLATVSALLAVAGVEQFLRGPTAIGVVTAAQLPIVCAFVLVLAAALRYEPRARARLAEAAALAERRRVARDLHDGLAQDLAFIAAHGPALSQELGEEHPLIIAARRALTVSRTTIRGLCDPADVTAAQALAAVAQELREQFDIAIAVNATDEVEVDPPAREHVARIGREAIANAVRHGGARNVAVSLTRLEQAVVLRIVDDGRGLGETLGSGSAEGFGLQSMRERAAALGGYLSVHEPRHGGTEVEVVFR